VKIRFPIKSSIIKVKRKVDMMCGNSHKFGVILRGKVDVK